MQFPRWMNWLFLAFLGYIVVVGNFSGTPQPVTDDALPPKQETKSYPRLNQLTSLRTWVGAVNPDAVAGCGAPEMDGLQIMVLREGDAKSAPLTCNSEVKLSVQQLEKNGQFGDAKTYTHRLNDAALPAPLRHGAFGMKQGEVRLIIASEQATEKQAIKNPASVTGGVWLVRR